MRHTHGNSGRRIVETFLFLFSLRTKIILVASQNCPCYISGNMSVVLLSTEGQRALGFHLKYLNLCSEDKRRSHGIETT